MKRTFAALAVLCLVPGLGQALEIKNIRPSYGPLGAARTATKFLPGDVLWVNFDIDGLALDEKTGKAMYETKLEFLDGTGKLKFEKKTPNAALPELGGARFPGDFHVIIGPNLEPGKYTVKLTVKDEIGKDSKAIIYPIEVLKPAFGFVGVQAPAIGLPGQHYVTSLGLAGFTLDPKKKGKELDVEVNIRVLDVNEKPVTRPVQILLPRDLPPEAERDKLEFVPLTYPLYLNRTGQFYIDITATDKYAGGKQIHMRYPLTVLDVGAITAGK